MRRLAPVWSSLLATAACVATAADARLYEMRYYQAPPGKLAALHARFRDHTIRLFGRHGMTSIGYFVPVGENPDRRLVYILAHRDRPARDASWKAFLADPEWKRVHAESERDGPLVARITSRFLTTTDYSPSLDVQAKHEGRVFELRTYTATPGNLPALNARFRDHTMGLFARHGMTNLIYWNLAADQPQADRMLVYLLSHTSVDAARQSFAAFRQDPEWLAVRMASEREAGGPLTEKEGGVISEFLTATDYSPLR